MQRLIHRAISDELSRLVSQYKVVTILGPRQAGKSTLAKSLFPDYGYVNLEDSALRREAEADPKGFLINHAAPLIIDEIQRCPALVSQVQANVDETDACGRYIITGSYQPEVRMTIAQSLATRTAVLHLLPLSFSELKAAGISLPRNEQIVTGFMPGIYSTPGIAPSEYYQNYRSVHLDKDIRSVHSFSDIRLFDVFLDVLAGRAGQLMNCSSISNDVGVSSVTISSWISLLENAYIVRLLPSWSKNPTSRAVKSPKLYFSETGLLVSLARISSPKEIGISSMTGAFFENIVVMEAFKARFNSAAEPRLYFFRDNNEVEVDLIFERSRNVLDLFEVKPAYSISKDFTRNMDRFENLHPNCAIRKHIIYSGETLSEPIDGVRYINYSDIESYFTEPEKYVPSF